MLETTWFILWGVLWAVYFMLDGFDLGLGALLPVLGKTDRDRRTIYNAMGPFWDGNEVWLITAGGATFAAFPRTYAVMFSTMYSALMLILVALILRGVAFEFRKLVDSSAWRSVWDGCLTVGSFLPALLFGVAFANIFQGIPFDADGVYHGSLLTLLNPYGLLGGLLFLLMFLNHGALWLAVKSGGDLSGAATTLARRIWPFLLVTAVIFLVASAFFTPLWNNYLDMPGFFIIPVLAVAGLVLTRIYNGRSEWKAWFSSALFILSATLFGVTGLYPNLFPSSINPAYSLNVTNSSSSPLTLKIMLGVVLVFIPLVIAYQTAVYFFFREKITDAHLASPEAY